jgi:hypothetical protein
MKRLFTKFAPFTLVVIVIFLVVAYVYSYVFLFSLITKLSDLLPMFSSFWGIITVVSAITLGVFWLKIIKFVIS